MSSATTTTDLDVVASVISLNNDQQRRVRRELVDWIAKPNGSTWDCEAAGLRLRAGVSVPGWCTADYRGHLLAVRNDAVTNARAVLIQRLTRVARMCYGHPLAYTGMRPEVTHATCTNLSLVSTAMSATGTPLGIAVRREDHWVHVANRRADSTTKWHLPRTSICTLTQYAILHGTDLVNVAKWGGYTDKGLLHEAGSGPIALGISRFTEKMIVVTPQPDATSRQINHCVAETVDAYRCLNRSEKRPRHLSLLVAKFEDVTKENT